MIKIAICDDESIQLEKINNLTKSILGNAALSYTVDTFLSGEELLLKLEKGIVYDIALLDIEMDKISGVEVGAILRQQFQNTRTILIYISAYESRAKEVFYINAIRFLAKPIEPELFKEALLYAYKLINEREKCFSFKDFTGKKIILPLTNILYFEITDSHRINVITSQIKYVYYGKMADINAKLSQNNFLRIHQAYLINFEHIREISYKEVIMDNNRPLMISGARRKDIRRQYFEIRFRRQQDWL
ncbi:LytR/AlgR family response regulator transcription factor [Lacrimispora brassicae]